ncbi:hypothetical protein ACH5RR_003137 [Cinchona calisaya]|uniref:Uncharacterized protein n=1 Tax=Cinchona calisaya TaxID=153742 RepID=A0ABD3ATZ2_9GENT
MALIDSVRTIKRVRLTSVGPVRLPLPHMDFGAKQAFIPLLIKTAGAIHISYQFLKRAPPSPFTRYEVLGDDVLIADTCVSQVYEQRSSISFFIGELFCPSIESFSILDEPGSKSSDLKAKEEKSALELLYGNVTTKMGLIQHSTFNKAWRCGSELRTNDSSEMRAVTAFFLLVSISNYNRLHNTMRSS